MELDLLKQKFYKSQPFKCSYINNNIEQRLFINLNKSNNNSHLFSILLQNGFRRNLTHMYIPVCEGCKSCISSRINVKNFILGKSHKRNLKKNIDLYFVKKIPNADEERFKLFQKYTRLRHTDGQMKNMSFKEFHSFLYDSPVETIIFDLVNNSKRILASIILDVLNNGLSAVYSFYDPSLLTRGIGIHLIIKSIFEAKKMNKNSLYLGYWIKESKKMNYKLQFNNVELFHNGKWTPKNF